LLSLALMMVTAMKMPTVMMDHPVRTEELMTMPIADAI